MGVMGASTVRVVGFPHARHEGRVCNGFYPLAQPMLQGIKSGWRGRLRSTTREG